jgi:hypothetical protein
MRESKFSLILLILWLIFHLFLQLGLKFEVLSLEEIHLVE